LKKWLIGGMVAIGPFIIVMILIAHIWASIFLIQAKEYFVTPLIR
jgi:hypothetical protein